MSDVENMAKVIKLAIRSSTAAWFESKHCKIYPKDKAAGLITPKCNSLQRKVQAVIDRFEDLGLPVRIIGLKPRQKGSTTFFSAVTYCFIRRMAANAVIIGGQFSQVEEAWGMWRTYQKNDTFDWGNTGEVNTKQGAWSHGSKLIGETARDVLAGVGGTHQVLHAFEVARWSKHGVANSAEVLGNLLKAIPNLPNTMIILESTAEGENGPFPERFNSAVTSEKFISGEVDVQPGSFVSIFAGWHEFSDSAMRLTAEQKKHIRDTLDADEEYAGEQELIDLYRFIDDEGVEHLGESVRDFDMWEQLAWRRWAIREECERDKFNFDRDYPHSAKVAFQKSGNLRFNATGLAIQRKRLAKRKPGIYGIIEETKGGRRFAFRPTAKNEARVRIFEQPIPNCRYLISVDPMTGITQTGGKDPDYHSAYAIRAGYWDAKGVWNRPATAARVVKSRWDIGVLEPDVWKLARMYGNQTGALIVIEMNQDKGLTELLRLRGANFYQREIFNQREQKTAKAFGFQTNEKTRENLVETVATAIREWDTPGAGIDIWDEEALDEFDNFVRKENGRSEASDGHHDDDVFGIGLGLTVIGHATTYVPERGLSGWWGPPELGGAPPTKPSAYS